MVDCTPLDLEWSAETTLVHDFSAPQSGGPAEVLWAVAVAPVEIGLVAVSRANMNVAVYRYNETAGGSSSSSATSSFAPASRNNAGSPSSSSSMTTSASGGTTATANGEVAKTRTRSQSGEQGKTTAAPDFVFYCSIDLSQEVQRTIRSLDFCPAPTGRGGILLACASFDAMTLVLHHNPSESALATAAAGKNSKTGMKDTMSSRGGRSTPQQLSEERVPVSPETLPTPWTVYTRFVGHDNEVKCVRFSPFGTYCATSGRDKAVYVYELGLVVGGGENGEGGAAFGGGGGHFDDVDDESGGMLNMANSCVAVFTDHTGDVNVPEWGLWQTLEVHKNIVWSLAYSPEGLQFASCSQDKTVRVWREVEEEEWGMLQQYPAAARMNESERKATDLLLLKAADGGIFSGIMQTTGKIETTPRSRMKNAHNQKNDSTTSSLALSSPAPKIAKSSWFGGIKSLLFGGGKAKASWAEGAAAASRQMAADFAARTALKKKQERQHPLVKKWVEAIVIENVHQWSIYSLHWARTLAGNDILLTAAGDNAVRLLLLDSVGPGAVGGSTTFRYDGGGGGTTQLDLERRWSDSKTRNRGSPPVLAEKTKTLPRDSNRGRFLYKEIGKEPKTSSPLGFHSRSLKMVSPVEARQEVRAYRECVEKSGKDSCKQQLQYAVNGVAGITGRDCTGFAEDFFQCYNHKFALATCDDSNTAKLIRCQSATASQVSSTAAGNLLC
eukprot:g2347.t1